MLGAAMLALTSPEFTLRWTHSVEKIEWVESWHIEPDALRIVHVAIKGSGAGMEPADDARLEDGWWVWSPDTEVEELNLAASGATGDGWHLCTVSDCQDLGTTPGAPITLKPCATR